MNTSNQTARFKDQDIRFANASVGRPIAFDSANPINFHQAISDHASMQSVTIDGKLFLPPAATKNEKLAVVIVVPGSLGVAVSHLAHAEAITELGFAAFVIDPFGARGVNSTVANQVQYSFAASAYDVLAAANALATLPEIDTTRIGAQGHSRGGSAVLSAAMARLADAVPGGHHLCAVYAAYPWCGHQFQNPQVGTTRVRAIIGDRDNWCLPQQVQGYMQAIRLAGGAASLRIVDDAAHSFDRESPIERIENAAVSPSAPTVYVADDGAFMHPLDGKPDPTLTDRDLMIYGMKAGYGVKGATIGSKPGQPALFRDDMIAFWKSALVR